MTVPDELLALLRGAAAPAELDGAALANLGERKALVWPVDDDTRVWAAPDGSAVWMVSVARPAWAGTPAQVRAQLGEPVLRADTALGSVALPGGLWVYADRGVAVHADEEDERVVRVDVFAPVDAGDFARLFATSARERRRPGRARP